jgi:hypothetical protein
MNWKPIYQSLPQISRFAEAIPDVVNTTDIAPS